MLKVCYHGGEVLAPLQKRATNIRIRHPLTPLLSWTMVFALGFCFMFWLCFCWSHGAYSACIAFVRLKGDSQPWALSVDRSWVCTSWTRARLCRCTVRLHYVLFFLFIMKYGNVVRTICRTEASPRAHTHLRLPGVCGVTACDEVRACWESGVFCGE